MSKIVVSSIGSDDVLYQFGTHQIGNLEGRLLTLIEASIQDQEQRKALKDILRQTIWNWAIENNSAQDHPHNHVPHPGLSSTV